MAGRLRERSLKLVLRHEGGFVNDPHDPGGATNRGVTLATARAAGLDKDGDGDVDVADVRALTEDDAVKVYTTRYWNAVRGNELPPGVDYCVVDAAVHSGPRQAVKWLQRAAGAVADGSLGPATLKAVRATDGHVLIDRLCDDRLAFMARLKTWPRYRNGWTRRVEEVRTEAKAMASATPSAPSAPVPSPEPAGFVAALMAFLAALKAWR